MVPADPVLSNPPGFVLLAIIFAVAAYLRQVAEVREKLLDEILGNKVWDFPLGETHTDSKIARLHSSKVILGWIARLVIIFTIAVAFRLLMLGYARYRFSGDPTHYANIFHVFDFAALLFVFLLICVLGAIHEFGRRSDQQIGKLQSLWRKRYLDRHGEAPDSQSWEEPGRKSAGSVPVARGTEDGDDRENLASLLELAKQHAQRAHELEEIEWKINFSVWAFLGALAYIATNDGQHVPGWIKTWSGLATVVAFPVMLHVVGVIKLYLQQQTQKEFRDRYKQRVERIVDHKRHAYSEKKTMGLSKTDWWWIGWDVLVTIMLGLGVLCLLR